MVAEYIPPAGAASSVATPDVSSGDSDPVTIKSGDATAAAATAGDVTIKGGDAEGDNGDAGNVLIDGGDGDDADGDVVIQGGILTVRKSGAVFSAGFDVEYDDGSIEAEDGGGGIGARQTIVGLLIVNRSADPDAYPDIGGNYILLVQDPNTGHAWGVTPAGYEYFDNPTGLGAPDDDDLNDHQRRQWYDATAGAPAFRFKQKDNAGTVTVGHSVGITDDGVIKLANLPTSDPHVADQLWNSGGTLKVSAG